MNGGDWPEIAGSQFSNGQRPATGSPGCGRATFGLGLLFRVVTACGLYFAVFQYSPLAAMLVTMIVTPALVRTAACVHEWRDHGGLPWHQQCRAFASSLLLVAAAAAAGLVSMIAVCCGFALAAAIFEMTVSHARPASPETLLLGATGGMIFGFAAALVTGVGIVSRCWWTLLPMPESQNRTASIAGPVGLSGRGPAAAVSHWQPSCRRSGG